MMLCRNPGCGAYLSFDTEECPNCHWPVHSTVSGPAPKTDQTQVPTGPLPDIPSKQADTPSHSSMPRTPSLLNVDKTLNGLIRQYPIPNQAGLFHFLYRLHCPFCNYIFHPSDCAIVWRNDDNQYVEVPAGYVHTIPRFFRRFSTKKLDGDYFRRDARRVCPRCSEHLPLRFGLDPSFTIAVIGDTTSGKSHYIASLLDLLKSSTMGQQGSMIIRFVALTEDTQHQFHMYEQKVFRDRKPLPRTENYVRNTNENFVKWKPLIFRLEIGHTVNGQFANNLLNLIFYDIAGEDIKNDRTMFITWPISQAQGIISIIDPLSMPIFRQFLLQNRQTHSTSLPPQGGKAVDIMNDVIFSLNEINVRGNQQDPITTPVAIMISKSDMIDEIAPQIGLQSARFLQQPIYNGKVDIDEMKQVDQEVAYFLSRLQERDLLHVKQRFECANYFATSATGCAPDPNNNYEFPVLRPRRCLDPLLWLLWKLSGAKHE